MPTIDRKPRPRRRTTASTGGPIANDAEFQKLVKDTAGDDDAWNAVRVQCGRYLIAKSPWLRDGAEALSLADAYHRAPHWLPLLPPISGGNHG